MKQMFMKPEDLVYKFRLEAKRMERLYMTFANLQPVALTWLAMAAKLSETADDLEETIARMATRVEA